MRSEVTETLLGKLVLVLSRATPEELAAIYQFATREPFESAECGMRSAELTGGQAEGPSGGSAECGMRSAEWKPGRADGCSRAGAKGGSPYVFRWTGRDWEVIFGGGRAFHLPNILGARYADYLLHQPNRPISAFDLEVTVLPEKGEARARNSIQPESDARALGEYREELRRLQAKRSELAAAGDADGLERMDNEVAALEAALTDSDGAADTGKRAFDNVRKAVGALRKHLRRGGPEERTFEEHLRGQLSVGHECLYSAPDGRVWG
jgi:hypothetical protein